VVLDTDLGSDVDDALALAVLLGSPEVELVGAVTGYGQVALRARLAAGFAALAGRRLTVVAGVAEPLSGRPVWLSGQEGRHFPDLGTAPVDPRGVGWLLDRARQARGELEIVAIGPLTNLAHAVRADPAFAASVHRVWLMGGRFGTHGRPQPDQPDQLDEPDEPVEPPEHNFASDAVAADEVLRSGLPITVLGVELTRRLRLYEPEIAALGTGALGAQLEREVRAWTAYWNEPYDVPHDAIAVIAMLRPDLFTRRPARVRVIPDGEFAGQVVEEPEDPEDGQRGRGSPVTVVTGLDVPAVTAEILHRIAVASQGEPCAT
jgi:purine nucleosidase